MLNDLLQSAIIVSVLASTLRIATPVLLAALGELVTEKAGVLNMGVEGMMLTGAFVGYFVTLNSGSLWLGVGAAMLAGAALSLIMAVMGVTLKLNQTVIGLGMNLLASGLTFYWYRVTSQEIGAVAPPKVDVFRVIKLPLLSDIPYLGEILFSQRSLTYIAFLMVPVVWFFLYRTKYGMALRGIGENPRAVDTKGLSVWKYQYLAVFFGGAMAGAGGAFLPLGSTALFVTEITAGRGWLAIVLVIAGNWLPWRVMIAALIFAFLDAFQLQMQGLGVKIPFQVLLALPYIAAIVAMMSARARSQAPTALGVPYARE
jgi:general nucleoside transport system permease protein